MYLTTQRVVNPHKQRKRSMKGNRDLEITLNQLKAKLKEHVYLGKEEYSK